ncbi:MAG: hemolysin family protein [Treponema sp.]|jgi:putative hemolysin|nr:hemolysin family protein [Treponema sp.]
MMDAPPAELFLIVILIVISGFFSSMETALISSRKSKLRSRALEENSNYKKVLDIAEHPGPFLFIFHAWIGFLRISAGIIGGFRIDRYFDAAFDASVPFSPHLRLLILCMTALLITLGAIFLGELIPRQIALASPEKLLAGVLPFIKILGFFLRPLMILTAGCSDLIYRILRIEASEPGITEDELRLALMEGEKSGVVESEERTMVEGVFYLGDRPVGAFMTHRSDIAWLALDAGAGEARKAALENGARQYFPIADGRLDEVVGIVSARDILAALLEKPWKGLKAIMTPPRFIPETMSALRAFEVFKREETDFLCVMDEYGGFAGALSVQDLIEEIVGEFEVDKEEILPREDGTFSAGGGANIDDVAEALAVDLPEHQEYHTLAGFILELAGEIPRPGMVFEWRGFRFKITAMDGNRIDRVAIYPPETAKTENL